MKKVALVASILAGLAIAAFLWMGGIHKPAIVRVNGPNSALQSAIREAQRGLPDFWKRVEAAPEAKQTEFAVRVKFETDQGPEYLWVRGPLVRKQVVAGTLDQEPVAYRNSHRGEIVRFPEADIVDWLIRKPGGPNEGGFTEAALTD